MTSKEALEKLYEEREYLLGEKVNHKTKNWHNDITHYDNINKCLLTIKQDLEHLEAIDNANPSEALESLKEIFNIYGETNSLEGTYALFLKIKKALMVLEIIKNKKVNMYHIWVFDNYQQYKEHYPFSEYHAIEDMLSENEFNLLKKVEE